MVIFEPLMSSSLGFWSEHDYDHGGQRRSDATGLADGEGTGDRETTIVFPTA